MENNFPSDESLIYEMKRKRSIFYGKVSSAYRLTEECQIVKIKETLLSSNVHSFIAENLYWNFYKIQTSVKKSLKSSLDEVPFIIIQGPPSQFAPVMLKATQH